MKGELGQCQVEGCSRLATYGIFRTSKGKKEWLYACSSHERIIGNENLKEAKYGTKESALSSR